MNLTDLQNHIGNNKKAGQIFSVMRSHLKATEITEHAGRSVYNYDIDTAINYFSNIAVDKTRARTDKQFNSYYEIQETLRQMRKKGIE